MPNSNLRLLFVCTKFGGRSVLASHLFNRISPWGEIAVAASFDPGKLPPSYFTFLESLGYAVDHSQPLSLFAHYKRGLPFDYVVMMCSDVSGEQCQIFRVSVNELYGRQAKTISWPIPDLSLISGTPDEVRAGFVRVIRELENHIGLLIQQLAADLRERPAVDQPPVNQQAN